MKLFLLAILIVNVSLLIPNAQAKRSFGITRSRSKSKSHSVRRDGHNTPDDHMPIPPPHHAPGGSHSHPKASAPEAPKPAPAGWNVGNHPAGPPPAYPGMGHHSVSPHGAPPAYSHGNAYPPSYSANAPKPGFNQYGHNQPHHGANNQPHYGATNQPHTPYNQPGPIYTNQNSFQPQQSPYGGNHIGGGPGMFGGGGGMMGGGMMGGGMMGGGYGGNYGYGQRSGSSFGFGNILAGLALFQVGRSLGSYGNHGSNREVHHYHETVRTEKVVEPAVAGAAPLPEISAKLPDAVMQNPTIPAETLPAIPENGEPVIIPVVVPAEEPFWFFGRYAPDFQNLIFPKDPAIPEETNTQVPLIQVSSSSSIEIS